MRMNIRWRRVCVTLASAVPFPFLLMAALSKSIDVHGDILIGNSPIAVWRVLTDEAQYPSWNPMIVRMSGSLAQGQRISITEGTGKDAMTFHPKVLRVQPGRELLWHGFLYAPGLVDVHHSFRLVPEHGGTRLLQSELYTGLLVNRWTEAQIRDTLGAVQALNDAIKQRAEATAASTP